MGANKTGMSKAAAGVCKVVDVFEDQTFMKPKSSAHLHRSATEDEKRVLCDLQKLKPFSLVTGRSHKFICGDFSRPIK